MQWEYKNFKPKDPIEVRYYTTPFPRVPQEVDPFVDRFLKQLRPNDSPKVALSRLREVMLAVYGCEPSDPEAKAFVSMQLWYHPIQGCSIAQLNASQNAVLGQLEKRTAEQR